MKLDVLQTDKEQPWFKDGLTFTCQQCGNCCTGAPGYVWISDEEVGRLAAFLQMSKDETIEQFCRRIGQRISLQERQNPAGLYDCVFLKDVKLKGGNVKRVCSVYDVRPLQCRTWPFWDGVLASRENWDAAAQRCHGMNRGSRKFTPTRIKSLRDATDWPDNPPTSRQTGAKAPRKPSGPR
ncbi:MAG: YkgJ family cysteine cluster protein [Tepidisphaeraceae bacterium]